MFYNVQNLFDHKHDEGKHDWQYLPMSYPNKANYCRKHTPKRYLQFCLETDWNEQKFRLKIKQIKRVIKSAGYPDIIGLSEVENLYSLRSLADALGYDGYVITEGKDKRGIDVALLFRTNKWFKYVRHTQHGIKSLGGRERLNTNFLRPILEVEFTTPKGRLVVYVLHWASQGKPTVFRTASAATLMSLITEQQRRDRHVSVLALGDFNVINEDYPHPFRALMDSKLLDAETAFREDPRIPDFQSNGISVGKKQMPLGTYFYPPLMRWDSLDRIFFSKNMLDGSGIEADVRGFRILSFPYLTKTFVYNRENEFYYGTSIKNVPNPYKDAATSVEKAGFSDHFGIILGIKTK